MSMSARLGAGLLPLGQLASQDLARRGARHLVDELDLAHALVVGDALLHEVHELVGRDRRACSELHERLRDLAGSFIRLADHSGVGDGRMLAEDRFDFRRPDPESFVLDELLLAVDDEDVAFLVDLAHVTGEEPSVPEYRRRVILLSPVATHDLWSADSDLAHLTRRQVAGPGLEVDDPV